jgi:hypothetical protein
MSNIKKTNEDSFNPNTIGTISKKSSFRQMTKPLLNIKTNPVPRLNELINDEIFQYYFRTHFNSKEYSRFKYYSENEKLNIIIDLYFYVMNRDIEKDQIIEYNNNNYDIDNENENDYIEKIFDNLLVLDNNQSRLNVIEKMKEYKLFTLNDENSYNNRFNKILNRYKNGNDEETINYYYDRTDKNRDNNINTNNNLNNRMNDGSNSNINYKPLSATKFNIKTISNNNNTDSVGKYKTQSLMYLNPNNNFNDNINMIKDNNIFNEISRPFIRNNIYDKINISNIQMIKLGKIRKKKINLEEDNNYMKYLLNLNDFEIKSKKNDIEEKEIKNNNDSINYKQLKPNINSKIKNNISPIIYNIDNNKIIYQEPLIITQSNIDNCKMNLLLKKQCNEGETNELIKKIYEFEGDNISFNKNEINKIGILLLNYIQLEKKFITMQTSLIIYKNKMSKMKEMILLFNQKAMKRINDSHAFIKKQIN